MFRIALAAIAAFLLLATPTTATAKRIPSVTADQLAAQTTGFTGFKMLMFTAKGLEPDSLYWGNAYFQAAGEDYTYSVGQVMAVDESGRVTFYMLLDFLDKDHEAGTIRFWVSTSYLGDPLWDTTAGAPALASTPVP